MQAIIDEKTKKYKDILTTISTFLDNIQKIKNPENEYVKKLQQDCESLLEIPNYGILDIDVFEIIDTIFNKIISLRKEVINKPKIDKSIPLILEELYENFKYLLQFVMVIIENEYLCK